MLLIQKYLKIRKLKKKRYELENILSASDCVKFLKKYNTIDDMINDINILYLYCPPTEKELQKLSILQQNHDSFDIYGFATTTMWIASIYFIETKMKLSRQKTWP